MRRGFGYVQATTRAGFKALFGSTDAGIHKSFLNSLVPLFHANNATDVEFLSGAAPALYTNFKNLHPPPLMELLVKTENGSEVIVQMEALRHAFSSQRGFYYASEMCGRQIATYAKLRPVAVVQVLDCNRDTDTVNKLDPGDQSPVQAEQHHTKHFSLRERDSGEDANCMHLVQINLSTMTGAVPMFPPQEDFTLLKWWLSLLAHSTSYTKTAVHSNAYMPRVIRDAFDRLDLAQWNELDAVAYLDENPVAPAPEPTAGAVTSAAHDKLSFAVELIRKGHLTVAKAGECLTPQETAQLNELVGGKNEVVDYVMRDAPLHFLAFHRTDNK